MSTLYLDKSGVQLDVSGAVMIMREEGKKTGSLPLAQIERIFLRGDVGLSAKVLARFGELDIGLVLLAGWQSKPTLFLPRAHADAQRRLRQAQHYANPAYRTEEIKVLLSDKIHSQIQVLEKSAVDNESVRYQVEHALRFLYAMPERLAGLKDIQALLGWEGATANAYFKALISLFPEWAGFQKRTRRPPNDPVNALMSLAYTLIHAEAVLALHGAGLDPDIGMLHSISYGRASMACDQMEPCRALIDLWLIEQFQTNQFSLSDFSTTDGACQLQKDARMRFYRLWETAVPAWRTQLRTRISELNNRMEQRLCVI